MHTQLLSAATLGEHLAHELKKWSYLPPALLRRVSTGNWQHAMELANRISDIAEREQHHPNLTIQYGVLIIELFSHDVKGITERDIHLARLINEVIQQQLSETNSD